MNKKSVGSKDAADKLVKNIRRKTARRYSAEEKIKKMTIKNRRLQHQKQAA
jgi:hypothetical protein